MFCSAVQFVRPGVGEDGFAVVHGLERQQHLLQCGERTGELAVGLGDHGPPCRRAARCRCHCLVYTSGVGPERARSTAGLLTAIWPPMGSGSRLSNAPYVVRRGADGAR